MSNSILESLCWFSIQEGVLSGTYLWNKGMTWGTHTGVWRNTSFLSICWESKLSFTPTSQPFTRITHSCSQIFSEHLLPPQTTTHLIFVKPQHWSHTRSPPDTQPFTQPHKQHRKIHAWSWTILFLNIYIYFKSVSIQSKKSQSLQTIRSLQTIWFRKWHRPEQHTHISISCLSHRAETMPSSTETVTSSTSAIGLVFSEVSRTETLLFSLPCIDDESCSTSTTTTVSFSSFFCSSVAAAVTSGFSVLSLPFSCSESSVWFLCVSPAFRSSSSPSSDSTDLEWNMNIHMKISKNSATSKGINLL